MKYFNKHFFFLFPIVLFFFISQVAAQENKVFQNLLGNLAKYANSNAPEKVYVQTDKDFYISGETVWLKAYILNGITHEASDKSRIVYVELIDSLDNSIAYRKLFTESAGAAGDIILPTTIKEGRYTLRAYTKYMLNEQNPVLFQKQITIGEFGTHLNYNKTSKEKTAYKDELKKEAASLKAMKPIVQFFPEGGDLIADIKSVLGVKVTDGKGNGLVTEGKIFDQDSTLISIFRSHDLGLGRVSFTASPNTDYYLQIETDGEMVKYPIPKPFLKGYALQVTNMGGNIKIRVATNIANGLQGALLVGHLRGKLILKQFLKSNDERYNTINLLTSKLQDGVAHFTLFAPSGEPVSERLIFIESPENSLKLSVKTGKSSYGFRNEVNVDLALVDDEGKPFDGDFSMSVVTQNGIQKDTENFKSWLLLNSDLGGTIADPYLFFQEESKGRKFLLDLLMLTHGWRRFAWQSFMDGGVRKEMAYPPEKGIMINGITTAFNNRYRPKKAVTTLNIMANEIVQEKKSTNAQGRFSFGPFFFQDSLETIINAQSLSQTNKKDDQIAIYLDPPAPSIKITDQKIPKVNRTAISYLEPYVKVAQQQILSDFEYDPKVTQLKEVVVKSKLKTRKAVINEKLSARTLYGDAHTRLVMDSIPWLVKGSNGVMEILRTVPGVRINGSFPVQTVQVRNGGGIGVLPLFLIDGVPFESDGVQVPDAIQSLPVDDILFIDVLKGPEANIYGSRAFGGVIAFYTKRGENFDAAPERIPGVTNSKIPGFYKAREFYEPNYAVTLTEHQKPDYRTTLYWAPDIKIKSGASSKLSFYTGDNSGKYAIRVEGITYDGIPVSELYNFNVNEDSP